MASKKDNTRRTGGVRIGGSKLQHKLATVFYFKQRRLELIQLPLVHDMYDTWHTLPIFPARVIPLRTEAVSMQVGSLLFSNDPTMLIKGDSFDTAYAAKLQALPKQMPASNQFYPALQCDSYRGNQRRLLGVLIPTPSPPSKSNTCAYSLPDMHKIHSANTNTLSSSDPNSWSCCSGQTLHLSCCFASTAIPLMWLWPQT